MSDTGQTFVCRYTGLNIYKTEDGYCAKNGHDYAADNAETLEEAKAQIDDYWESWKGL